ncbi:MAG: Mur ligase domain-containing protein [Spirochaetes bacterium]|nr:Mur ligase domain-containing protein [Spirochaetota bacterium]
MLFNILKNHKSNKEKFKFCSKKEEIFEENKKLLNIIENSNHIYFLGISGIGMSALARLFIQLGKKVSGSSDKENEITRKLKESNIDVYIKHSENNITSDIDLLIYTEAVSKDNPELLKAKELKIPVMSYGEGLSYFFNKYLSVAIAGTHGKSSSTALIVESVSNVFNTYFLCGSVIKKFGLNGGYLENSYKFFERKFSGQTKNELQIDFYINEQNNKIAVNESNINKEKDILRLNEIIFVGEACEYKETFANFFPTIILITSLDEDHLDYYKNGKNYIKSFKHFIEHFMLNHNKDKVIKNLVLHVNNKFERKLAKYICSKKYLRERVVFYTPDKSFFLSNCCKNKDVPTVYYQYKGYDSSLELFYTKLYFNSAYKKEFGYIDEFDLYFPFPSQKYGGNITGVYIVLRSLKMFNEVIFYSISDYGGIERRFDFLGIDIFDNKVYTDYAHHPSEIKTLLEMFKEFYKEKKIIFIFQPHQYSRTYLLFDDFMDSFYNADLTIITQIYEQRDSIRDKEKINARIFVEGLLKKGINAIEVKDDKELFSFLENNINNSIIVFAGAGDIYNTAKNYLKNYIKV